MTTAKSKYWQSIVDKAQVNKIIGLETTPFFTLAPMEAVTDTVFRRIVAHAASPDVFYTEFTNAKSISHPKAKFSVQKRLYYVENEQKPIVQLWGNKGIDFENAIPTLKELNYEAIDINTGCPDSTVIKNGGGCDLIRNFDSAAEIISSAKKSNLPVSVKTRLGFNKIETYKEWIPFLLEQDIDVLSIHLRTRKEMSKVPAHYEYIDDIIKLRDSISPNTLLQFNGDIKNRSEGLALAKEHPGIDGIMIGSGIFEDPFAFELVPKNHSLNEMLDLLKLQLNIYDDFSKSGTMNFQKLKRFFKIYIRNFSYASDLRLSLMETSSSDEARTVIDLFIENYKK